MSHPLPIDEKAVPSPDPHGRPGQYDAIPELSSSYQLQRTTTQQSMVSQKGDTVAVGAMTAEGVGTTPELALEAEEAAEGRRDVESAQPEPEFPVLSIWRIMAIAMVTTLAMALSGAGNMSLSISLPDIQRDLKVRDSELHWISAAFALTNGCFLLLSGRLADVYGRKTCFIIGVAWYAIWNLIGGFMQNTAAFVVTRALAGMGSALSIPSSIGIIASTFTGRTRSSAFACFSAGGPIGGGLGFTLGGVLTAYTEPKWRAALWLFAGMAAFVAVAACFVVLPDRHLDPDRRIDWAGAALVTCGLVLLMFAISSAEAAPQGWRTPYIIAVIVVSVFLIACFFVWEHFVEHRTSRPPLMRLALWTRSKGKLAAVYFIGGISWMGFTTFFYNGTLFFQNVQGASVITAMLRFLPSTISGLICNVVVAKIVHIVPGHLLICFGIAATGVANIFMALSDADAMYWKLPFNAMWLAVLGADFLISVGSIFVSTLALPEEQSVAGALFQTMVQLGGALGLAFVNVVQTSITMKQMEKGDDHRIALMKGLHGAFYFAAGASFASMLIALVMLRGMGAYGAKKKTSIKSKDSADSNESEATRVEQSPADTAEVPVVEKSSEKAKAPDADPVTQK